MTSFERPLDMYVVWIFLFEERAYT